MSNRKENIKKTLGISEYPWSSDDEDDTSPSTGQNVCSILQHHLPAPRPSVADTPGTSGAGSSNSAPTPRLSVGSTSRAQSKLDRDMYWSLINSPRGRASAIHSSQSRLSDARNITRTNHTPAVELREAANERPSSAADIRRIMAFKKLNRSLSSRPSKTALNLCVQRSASSLNVRHLFSQSEATEIVAKIRASRAKRLSHVQNAINHCRSNLLTALQSSSGEVSAGAEGAGAHYPRPADSAVTVDHSDEDADIFSSTRLDGLTNEENHETRDQVEEPHNSSAGGVSLEEEIVEIEADPVIHIDDQTPSNEQPTEANNNNNEVGNTDTNEEQQQSGKRRRIGSEDDEESCTMKELNQRLLRVLECPVCLEWAGAPVAQCRRGHVLCGECRRRLATCPVCRAAFSSVRNRAAEAVAELLRYPCRHGCGRELRSRRRAAHEASCAARRYACPAPGCQARAPLLLADLRAHLRAKHAPQLKDGRAHSFSMRVNTKQHSHWFIMALQELFHLRVDVDINTWGVIIYVAYIGPKCNAKKYSYEVSVTGQHNSRKFTYTRCTHSDLEDSALNLNRQDCFHLTFDQAMNFLRFKNRHCDPDKFLEFNVEIGNTMVEMKGDSDS